MGDAVDLETLRLGKVVDVVDHGAEFIHRGHRIGLTRRRRAARAAHHRQDFLGRVDVAGHKEELHLGGHDRLPPLVAVKLHHAFEHIARRIGHRLVVAVIGVVDDLKRPVPGPRCGGGRVHIRAQDHVFFDETVIARRFAPFAGDGLVKDAVGQVEILLPREFRRRDGLAPGDAGQVGDDTFHFVQTPALKIGARRFG